MEPIYPRKWKEGDTLAVVAPSDSLSEITEDNLHRAERRLNGLGLNLAYSWHAFERGPLGPADDWGRVNDLMWAFNDDNVAGILCAYGGFAANHLLPLLDYKAIAAHPKALVGFSDNTALLAGIHAKTGLVTYNGPHFSDFAMEQGFSYTLDHFLACLGGTEPYDMEESGMISSDFWWMDQQNRRFAPNPGMRVVQTGEAEGLSLGPNLCTLNLLQGTDYMPELAGRILFLEDDATAGGAFGMEFDRNLHSLSQQRGFDQIRGLVVGRWLPESGMDEDTMRTILKGVPGLAGKPVVMGADFGHSQPLCSFPIGGRTRLVCTETGARVTFLEH